VQTAFGSNTPLQASEPITLVTSMSERQRSRNWPYLNQYFPEPASLPYVLQVTSLGGGVVGVIERADSPPPPPPSGIPTPRQATDAGTVTGVPADAN
jgi:hypothetical protein